MATKEEETRIGKAIKDIWKLYPGHSEDELRVVFDENYKDFVRILREDNRSMILHKNEVMLYIKARNEKNVEKIKEAIESIKTYLCQLL